jgi:hypothetical protein
MTNEKGSAIRLGRSHRRPADGTELEPNGVFVHTHDLVGGTSTSARETRAILTYNRFAVAVLPAAAHADTKVHPSTT